MKTYLPELLAAQTTLLQQPPESPLRRTTLLGLASIVPAPVLAHFLRMVEQGRAGVTIVHHGVCSGCHLRLPSGQVAALAKSDAIHLCENCGSYLVLAPGDTPAPAARPSVPVAAPRRRQRVCEAVPA
jgi:hypothetical protein